LLRLIGELLLLGSAASWALLALGLWIAELYGAPPLPVFESILGVVALLGGWRFIPKNWPASVPILFQATVVYLFIAAIVASGADPDMAVVWIVIWSATAICVTTLALGFVTSVSLVISGTLLLNILIGWLYPSLIWPFGTQHDRAGRLSSHRHHHPRRLLPDDSSQQRSKAA
jgi:hypothetical protein